MTSRTDPDLAEELAELIVHLGRAARSEAGTAVLTPAQWTALRFFARANRRSRTPSAFASFHATTRGTASQTVRALERAGYLCRSRDETDRRSVRYDVTEAGQTLLDRDPLRVLAGAIAVLPAPDRAALSEIVPALSAAVASQRGGPSFGSCGDCVHFQPAGAAGHCACLAAELAPEDLGRLCASFAAKPPDTVPRLRPGART